VRLRSAPTGGDSPGVSEDGAVCCFRSQVWIAPERPPMIGTWPSAPRCGSDAVDGAQRSTPKNPRGLLVNNCLVTIELAILRNISYNSLTNECVGEDSVEMNVGLCIIPRCLISLCRRSYKYWPSSSFMIVIWSSVSASPGISFYLARYSHLCLLLMVELNRLIINFFQS